MLLDVEMVKFQQYRKGAFIIKRLIEPAINQIGKRIWESHILTFRI